MKKIFVFTMSIAFLSTASISFAQGVGAVSTKTPSVEKSEKVSATSSMKGIDAGTKMNSSPRPSKDMKEMGQEEMHRSVVASFVQTLLDAADRMDGASSEVRAIAQEQVTSSEKVIDAVKNTKKRGWIKTMLIGSDYKNLGAIRSEMMTTENRMERLIRETERIVLPADRMAIMDEIQLIRDEQAKLKTFIEANESKFSLFGWAARLFQK